MCSFVNFTFKIKLHVHEQMMVLMRSNTALSLKHAIQNYLGKLGSSPSGLWSLLPAAHLLLRPCTGGRESTGCAQATAGAKGPGNLKILDTTSSKQFITQQDTLHLAEEDSSADSTPALRPEHGVWPGRQARRSTRHTLPYRHALAARGSTSAM